MAKQRIPNGKYTKEFREEAVKGGEKGTGCSTQHWQYFPVMLKARN